MAFHCPNCGEELSTKTKFCNKCGANLGEAGGDELTVVGNQATGDEATIAIAQGPTQAMAESVAEDESLRVMPGFETSEDDGQTVAMPGTQTVEDDGQTKAMFEAPEAEDDGQTKAMPGLDDGQTKAMPDSAAAEQKSGRKITATAIADLKTGRVLQERYRLDKILGKGGFGAAFLAEDLKLKRACVVKQMLAPEGASAQELELHRANFEREASLLVQLNHPGHPNIPEIYDYFSDAGGNYLVMKYIEGQSLKGVLDKDEGKIPWREAVRYVVDVCSALNYMHTLSDEPVMHRDIKPANILLGDDGRVWLVDFGLAKAKPVESTGDLMATQAAGSVGYTPLEQWLGEATPASDVYALGATLHHLVTGLHPMKAFGEEFNVQKLKDMHGQFTPVSKIDKSLPKQLDQIIPRATAPEAHERLTPQQLQKELEALISGAQAAALYTFKNGESAKTVPDLVILCEKNRQEAQAYLYHGDFERWFLLINRNDLAEAAVQAVKQGKNQRDGLERFLKLILPNLFLNRLNRATRRMARATILFGLALVVVVVLLAIGGSYLGGWFMQQSITSYTWNFDNLDLDEANRFTEAQINEGAQSITEVYFDDFHIDMRPPNLIDMNASWGGLSFKLPLILQVENGKPHFYLQGINDIPLPLIADNISQGINDGIDDVFQKAPVDISELAVADNEVTFRVEPSGRVPLPTPTPTITLTPTPAPTPTITPTPEGVALIAVFNELDQDVILEVEGESWEIAANDTKVIEKKPGTYNYVVKYKDSGAIASEGSKTWAVSSYKWRITLE